MKKFTMMLVVLFALEGFANAESDWVRIIDRGIDRGADVTINSKQQTEESNRERTRQTGETDREKIRTNGQVDIAVVIADGNVRVNEAWANAQKHEADSRVRIEEIRAGVEKRKASATYSRLANGSRGPLRTR